MVSPSRVPKPTRPSCSYRIQRVTFPTLRSSGSRGFSDLTARRRDSPEAGRAALRRDRIDSWDRDQCAPAPRRGRPTPDSVPRRLVSSNGNASRSRRRIPSPSAIGLHPGPAPSAGVPPPTDRTADRGLTVCDPLPRRTDPGPLARRPAALLRLHPGSGPRLRGPAGGREAQGSAGTRPAPQGRHPGTRWRPRASSCPAGATALRPQLGARHRAAGHRVRPRLRGAQDRKAAALLALRRHGHRHPPGLAEPRPGGAARLARDPPIRPDASSRCAGRWPASARAIRPG